MKCHCMQTDSKFILCVEEVDSAQLEEVIQHAGWRKCGNKLLLSCAQEEILHPRDKELVSVNFARMGPAVFESMLTGFDWEKPLELLSRRFNENRIEWYIVGSVGDAVRGIDVKPHDMDIVVHTRDFHKAANICRSSFPDSIILPFSDNQKLCPLRCFGRLFLTGALVEIAADETWNLEQRQPKYEKVLWQGQELYLDSLQLRYQIELARKREDRIKAFDAYMNQCKHDRG